MLAVQVRVGVCHRFSEVHKIFMDGREFCERQGPIRRQQDGPDFRLPTSPWRRISRGATSPIARATETSRRARRGHSASLRSQSPRPRGRGAPGCQCAAQRCANLHSAAGRRQAPRRKSRQAPGAVSRVTLPSCRSSAHTCRRRGPPAALAQGRRIRIERRAPLPPGGEERGCRPTELHPVHFTPILHPVHFTSILHPIHVTSMLRPFFLFYSHISHRVAYEGARSTQLARASPRASTPASVP